MDRNLLEVYFEQAEHAADEAQWRRIVDKEINVMVAEWESALEALLTDQEKELEWGELREELSNEKSEWLVTGFLGNVDEGAVERLYESISEANKDYLFEYDQQKKTFSGDSAGDLKLKSTDGFEEDHTACRKAVVGGWLDEIMAAWGEKAGVSSPELLAPGD